LYIAPQLQQALQEFQEQVKAGRGQQAIDALTEVQREQREQTLKSFAEVQRTADLRGVIRFIDESVMKSEDDRQRMAMVLHGVKQDAKPEELKAPLYKAVQECLIAQQQETNDNLQKRLKAAQAGKRNHRDDPEFRMLHLELRVIPMIALAGLGGLQTL